MVGAHAVHHTHTVHHGHLAHSHHGHVLGNGRQNMMSQRHGRSKDDVYGDKHVEEDSGANEENGRSNHRKKSVEKVQQAFIDDLAPNESRIEGQVEFWIGNRPPQPRHAALKQTSLVISRSPDDANPEIVDLNAVEGMTFVEDPRIDDKAMRHRELHLHSTFRRQSVQHASEKVGPIERTPSQNPFPTLQKTNSIGRHDDFQAETPNDYRVTQEEIVLLTYPQGFYRGSTIHLKFENMVLKDMWMESIRRVLRAGHTTETFLTDFQVFRAKTRIVYLHENTQLVVATLIIGNFLVNIMDAQARGEAQKTVLSQLDNVFTYLFTVELLMNMFANLVLPFFSDGWNYFDGIVVLVSWLSMSTDSLPGGNVLKLLRTVRVFRLFKRIPSLYKMVSSLQRALPSMGQAYILVCILLAIFTILAVTFFKNLKPAYFGGFFPGAFSLWQIMTGDDWSVVVRELMEESGSPVLVALFFVVFQLIITFTLINVFVCVLVDDFCTPPVNEGRNPKPVNPSSRDCLSSLMFDLILSYDVENYEQKARETWKKVCTSSGKIKEARFSERGVLNFCELRDGLRSLGYFPPVAFTLDDWNSKIVKKDLCDDEGLVSRTHFLQMLKNSLLTFEKDSVAQAFGGSDEDWNSDSIFTALCVIKNRAIRAAERSRDMEALTMEDERGGASTARRKQNSSGKSPAQLMLTSMVKEMNRMHRRFNEVESVVKENRRELQRDMGWSSSEISLEAAALNKRDSLVPHATGNGVKVSIPLVSARSGTGEGDSSDLSGATTQHSPQVHAEGSGGLNLGGITNLFSPPGGGNNLLGLDSLWGGKREAQTQE